MFKKIFAALLMFSVAGLAVAANTAPTTFSGGGLTGLDDLLDLIKAFSEGSLGKVIATAMFLVGLGAGIIRQSVIAVVAGMGAAASLTFGPQIIEGVFSAVI